MNKPTKKPEFNFGDMVTVHWIETPMMVEAIQMKPFGYNYKLRNPDTITYDDTPWIDEGYLRKYVPPTIKIKCEKCGNQDNGLFVIGFTNKVSWQAPNADTLVCGCCGEVLKLI